MFPLSLSELALWFALMEILLIVGSKIILPYSNHFGQFVMDKKRVLIVEVFLGAAFLVTIFLSATASSALV